MANIKDENNPYDLNEHQLQFCDSYLRTFNATQAYIEAYKVNYKIANASGPRLLVNVSVRKELKRRQKVIRKNAFIKAENVFNKMVSIAFSDINDFVDFEHSIEKQRDMFGNPLKCPVSKEFLTYVKNYVKAKKSENIDTSLIQEISAGKDGFKIKLIDKKWALDFLIKYFELDVDSQHRKLIDKKRLELEEKRIKVEESSDESKDKIKEFINSIKKNQNELKEIFDDE